MSDDATEVDRDDEAPSEGDPEWREQTQERQDEHAPRPPAPRGIDPRDNHS
jgi:hypothetical protein